MGGEKMGLITVGSLNQTKVAAVEMEFPRWKIIKVHAASNVLSQPIGHEMTRRGAINRANQALNASNDHCQISIGLEGGVVWIGENLYVCNWGALVTTDGHLFTASGAAIPLPASFQEEILAGKELGDILDDYANRHRINIAEGAVGYFTDTLVDRKTMYRHIVSLLKGQWQFALKKAKNI